VRYTQDNGNEKVRFWVAEKVQQGKIKFQKEKLCVEITLKK
jgi:hypothetical protein